MLDLRIDAARAVIGDLVRAASVGVVDGRIVSVTRYGDGSVAGEDAESVLTLGADEVLMPGLVDTHVHLDEPGHPDWEGFASGTRAAAAGGVTTLVDMPLDSLPVTTNTPALQAKQAAAAGKCWVDVGFWAGLVPGNVGELAGLRDAGALGFKCFLIDSGTPEFPPVDADELLAGMTEIARLGLPLLVHAESPADVTPAPKSRRYMDFLASRPDSSERRAVELVISSARRTGARAHIVHVSSAASLAPLAAARADGLPITAETCPHYLALNAEHVDDGATLYACCPPIRSAANADLLWAGLAEGTLDMVVSDHSPSAPELKHLDTGDFGQAWGGISSLQLGLSVLWTAGRERGVGLAQLSRWMSTAPAALAGLSDRGAIRPGAKADLCVFAPDVEWTVEPRELLHRQPLTPYAGAHLTGRVTQTLLAGRPLGQQPQGQLLERVGAPCG